MDWGYGGQCISLSKVQSLTGYAMPQLIAAGHTLTYFASPPGAIDDYLWIKRRQTDGPCPDHAALKFCQRYLSQAQLQDRTWDISQRFMIRHYPMETRELQLHPWADFSQFPYAVYMGFAYQMISFLAHGATNARTYRRAHVPKLPSPLRIPFSSLLRRTLLFSSPETFSTCHLDNMTSQEFLEAGKWKGCWADAQNELVSGFSHFNPIMSGIQFKVNYVGTNEEMAFEAVGLEAPLTRGSGERSFIIKGTLSQQTGDLRAHKRYVEELVKSALHGIMTPFGLFGYWSRFGQ